MLRNLLTKFKTRPANFRRLRGRSLRLLSLEDRLAPAIVTVYVFDNDFSINLPGNPIVDAKINLNDTIRWQWVSGNHSAQSAAGQLESWNSGVTNQKGFTYDHTFTHQGAFNYYCKLHGADAGGGQVTGMSGTIVVGDATIPPGPTYLDPLTQPRFVNALPIPSVMQPTTPGGTNYEIPVLQVQQDLGLKNPSNGLPLLTTVWGYNGTYPAATIEATRNQPITVHWTNQLISGGTPLPHLLADSLMVPIPASGVPIVPHLHGGHTESASDGIPEAWFTPNFAATGPDFRQQTYRYDNDQPAATLWYHDHANLITPQNVYAGLAGFYILRDPFETALNLPSGAYEIPLAIQDRLFTEDGKLTYPPAPMATGAVGNFILVNGKAWPSLEVEPRKYRFRMLNGSDSRTFNVNMAVQGGGTAPAFVQIGSDQGFLAASRTTTSFLMMAGDRRDVIIDFSDPALTGKTIILNNSATVPFPGGTAPDPATVGQLMAFKVTLPLAGPDTSVVPTTLRPPPDPGTSTNTRQLLLSMGEGPMGFSMLLGTVSAGRMAFDDPVTENINLNDTETWEFYNDTEIAHPMHMHLVQFQVVSHQGFTATTDSVTGALSNIQLVGSPLPPGAEDAGPEDTVMVNPGEVLRVVAKFDRPGEYVWHCHMLTHENMDMMRPIQVRSVLSIADMSIAEGNSGSKLATFTLNLNGPADFPVTVNFATAPGTAIAGSDFQSTSGVATIPLGQTSTTITIPILGDATGEPNETFLVSLSGVSDGAVISDGQATGTILDDDILPQVASVATNEGAAQRSRVTTIKVNFNSPVTLPMNPANAFQLKRQSDNALVGLTAMVTNGATTSVTFTFTGALSEYGSLADGRYTLTVDASMVSNLAGQLDGNGDGTPSDNYVSPATGPGSIHRLFGDSNGDALVNSEDFAAFRSFFGLAGPSMFDFDGDNQTNSTDFAEFRKRFGLMI